MTTPARLSLTVRRYRPGWSKLTFSVTVRFLLAGTWTRCWANSEPLRSNVEDADEVLQGHDYAIVVLRKKYLDDCRRDFEGMFNIREIMADPDMVPGEGYEYTVVALHHK